MTRVSLPALAALCTAAASGASAIPADAAPTPAPAPKAPIQRVPAAPAPPDPRRELQDRLARAELLAGLTPLTGPGLVVTLRPSPVVLPPGVDRKVTLIQEQDVSALLNAIRGAGAEALAMGGQGTSPAERVLAGTAAKTNGNGLLVNGVMLKPPFRILAIGDARTMRAELFREGGVVRQAGLDRLQMITVQDVKVVQVPAARAMTPFKYARAAGPGAAAATVQPSAPGPVPAANSAAAPARSAHARSTGEVRTVRAVVARGDASGTVRTAALPAARPAGPVRLARAAVPALRPVSSRSLAPSISASPAKKTIHPAAPRPAPKQEAPQAAGRSKRGAKTSKDPRMRPTARKKVAGAVFGGKGYKRYHRSGCPVGDQIDPLKRVSFRSAAEAVKQGREGCPNCSAD
jgi:uncharacterized protein DUF881